MTFRSNPCSLNDDTLFHVLTFLDLKTFLRFRYVSKGIRKQWFERFNHYEIGYHLRASVGWSWRDYKIHYLSIFSDDYNDTAHFKSHCIRQRDWNDTPLDVKTEEFDFDGITCTLYGFCLLDISGKKMKHWQYYLDTAEMGLILATFFRYGDRDRLNRPEILDYFDELGFLCFDDVLSLAKEWCYRLKYYEMRHLLFPNKTSK